MLGRQGKHGQEGRSRVSNSYGLDKHVRSPIAKIMYFARSYAVFMQDFLAQYDADMIVLC